MYPSRRRLKLRVRKRLLDSSVMRSVEVDARWETSGDERDQVPDQDDH
jgi:hypothetical protein